MGGTVPRNFIPAVEKGLRDNIQHGVLAGFPVVGLTAQLYDGCYHPVDSSEMAFKTAARIAFKQLHRMPVPCCSSRSITSKCMVPDEYMGDIIGDMNKRRGRIMGMDQVDGLPVRHRGGAAGRNVQVRDRPAFYDPVPRQLHHEV